MYPNAIRSRDHFGLSPDTTGTEYVLVGAARQTAGGPTIDTGAAIGVDVTMFIKRDVDRGAVHPESVPSDTAVIRYVPAVFHIILVWNPDLKLTVATLVLTGLFVAGSTTDHKMLAGNPLETSP